MDKVLQAVEKGYTVDNNRNVVGIRGLPLKIWENKCGYYVFSIRVGKKAKTILYHRFLAYFKFGEKMFEKGIEVRHLNGVRTDNCFDNIEIGTHSENMMDKPKHVRQLMAKMSNKKHSDEFIDKLRKERLLGKTYKQLKEEFGLCKATLSYYLGGNCKKKQVFIEGLS